MVYGNLFIIISFVYALSIIIERSILRGRDCGFSPLTLFSPIWIVSILLLALPIHEYMFGLSDISYYYIIFLHIFFSVGCILGVILFKIPYSNQERLALVEASPRATAAFLVLGIIGVFIFATDVLLTSGLSFGSRFSMDQMSMIKEEYSDPNRTSRLGGMIMTIGYYFYGFGQIGIVCHRYSVNHMMKINKLNQIFCFSFMGIAAFNSILITGGRIELVIIILIYVLSSKTLRDRAGSIYIPPGIVFRRFFALFVAAAILWLGLVMLSSRVGGSQNSAYMLYLIHQAKISDELIDLATDYPMLSTLILQLSYVTAPIPFLGKFVDYYSYGRPQLFYGFLNFHPSLDLMNRFIGVVDASFQTEAKNARVTILENMGYFGNVWATLGRELLVDFGIFGSLLFFFLLGLCANAIRLRLWKAPAFEFAVLYVFIRIQILWSLGHGLFHHRTFGYAFTLAVFLVVTMAVLRTIKKSGAQTNE